MRVLHGTAEILARVLPREPIRPGERGLARLALEGPVVARGGDRFVLRSYSPVTTIGGGLVLDPLPPLRRAAWPAAEWPQAPPAPEVQQRLAELTERENAIRADSQFFERWIAQAPETEIVSYFDRLKLYGETAAMDWLKNRNEPR